MPQRLVRVVAMKIDDDTRWAEADVRVDNVIIYGFQVEPNDQGHPRVHGPQREVRVGRFGKVFDYLDDELEEQVDQALRKAYAKEWDKVETPKKGPDEE